jgi:hypothetical protein
MVRVRAAVFLCTAAGVIAAAPLAGCTAGGHAPAPVVSAARSSPRASSGGSLAAGSVARFAGVSCTSPPACTAVGSTEVGTLAERWDGRRWAIQQTPSPGSGAALSAVSCAGPAWCMAVGSSGSLGSQTALAELWDGRTWSVRLPVTPPDGHARLLGVSCPAPGMCLAVGDHSGGPALAELWNGTSWAVLPLASLPGAQIGPLGSVSCTSPAACTAVGSYASSSSGPGTVAERWNGVRWAVRVTPPAGALYGVSCAAATACTGVGLSQYHNGGYRVSVALGWDGTRWAAQPVPNPAHNAGTEVLGVSCPSRGACFAVGDYTPAGVIAGYATLAERWEGTRWAIQAVPNPPGSGFKALAGVSCSSAAACMAVGSGGVGGGPLAERWDGARWAIVPAPAPPPVPVPGSATLAGVSCTSAASCTAVGWDFTTATTSRAPLAEHWDGSSWLAQQIPNPVVRGQGSELMAVSCTSRSACTAVGERGSLPFATLAERWDGRRWAVQPTVNPPGNDKPLVGVACTSAGSCTAVGYHLLSRGLGLTLAEHWNGARWARQHTPGPPVVPAGGGSLTAIGCSSAAACTAVGIADSVLPVIDRWNGARWVLQHSPRVQHPGPGELWSVSCPAAAVCLAAGDTGENGSPSGDAHALAERWDGRAWVIQRVPEPPGTAYSSLKGISCSSPVACTAVGEFGAPAGTLALAERWNGKTWAIQPTPNPPRGNLPGAVAYLTAVSCPSATACVAVGQSNAGALVAELWNGKTWAIQHLPG